MRFSSSLAILCTLFIATPIDATRIRRLSLAELRDQASTILVVDVERSSLRIGRAGMTWTDYRATVVEVLQGGQHAGDWIVLSFARGIDGVWTLDRGGRYLIFVDGATERPMPTVGWGQGLFRQSPAGMWISATNETLAIDQAGRIGRMRERRTDRAEPGRHLSDPIVIDSAGRSVEQIPAESSKAAAPFDRKATLADLRHFVRRLILERAEPRLTP